MLIMHEVKAGSVGSIVSFTPLVAILRTYSDLYHPSLKCINSSIFIIFLGVGGFSDYISGGCEASSQTTIINSGRYTMNCLK